MFTIIFSILLDGEMFSKSYTYYCYQSVMITVDNIINDYALIPAMDGDCWTITVLYNTHTILTLNSAMF